MVERATGISRSTIVRGIRETQSGTPVDLDRTRKMGGGRKKATDKDETLAADLEGLVEPRASGDPQSPLRWSVKSVRRLAEELRAMGHQASHRLVADLLQESGYSLRANRKNREGPQHPDRDAQFRYINEQVRRFQRHAQPAVSVDTKKKELVGDFKNAGQEWRPKGAAEPVRVHDFLIPGQGHSSLVVRDEPAEGEVCTRTGEQSGTRQVLLPPRKAGCAPLPTVGRFRRGTPRRRPPRG
jgi:Rhodopirellula transposase DDE domain